MCGIKGGFVVEAGAEPRWGSMIWKGGVVRVYQGRLAKARQPFAMMRKPFGLPRTAVKPPSSCGETGWEDESVSDIVLRTKLGCLCVSFFDLAIIQMD